MIKDIIEKGLYGEIILIFLAVAWFFVRYIQRKHQKREGWNNFEFWIYYNLVDFYKFNGYPYPEISARDETNLIIKRKNDECKTTN